MNRNIGKQKIKASLDCFIYKHNFPFYTKWSRLGFQWPGPLENQTKYSGDMNNDHLKIGNI